MACSRLSDTSSQERVYFTLGKSPVTSWIKLVRPLSTVGNARGYARVSHSRQWSNYNFYGGAFSVHFIFVCLNEFHVPLPYGAINDDDRDGHSAGELRWAKVDVTPTTSRTGAAQALSHRVSGKDGSTSTVGWVGWNITGL